MHRALTPVSSVGAFDGSCLLHPPQRPCIVRCCAQLRRCCVKQNCSRSAHLCVLVEGVGALLSLQRSRLLLPWSTTSFSGGDLGQVQAVCWPFGLSFCCRLFACIASVSLHLCAFFRAWPELFSFVCWAVCASRRLWTSCWWGCCARDKCSVLAVFFCQTIPVVTRCLSDWVAQATGECWQVLLAAWDW